MADNPFDIFKQVLGGDTKPVDQEELFNRHGAANQIDPGLLRAVAKNESSFDPHAVSKKGAQGMMQLMPDTQKRLGVTDPYDMEQNVGGGAKELKRLWDKYHDIPKTVAAYNAGEEAVDKYGGVPPFPETMKYVDDVQKDYQSNPFEQFKMALGGGESKAGPNSALLARHQRNVKAEAALQGRNKYQMAADITAGATPAVAAAASLIPGGGPLAQSAIFAGGEALKQYFQKQGGAREEYNPYAIVGQGALGAIPLPDFAKKLASKTPTPSMWYPMFKGLEGIPQGVGFDVAGRGMDYATRKMGGEQMGANEPLSLGEIVNSGLSGGAFSMLGSFARIHSITREAHDMNYKNGGNNVYRGVNMPLKGQRAEFMQGVFDKWLDIVHDYTDTHGVKINSLDDLRKTTGQMNNEYYQNNYRPLVDPIRQQQVSTQPIYDALDKYLLDNRKLMNENPRLKDRLMKKVDVYKGATTSVDDLEKTRMSHNEANKNLDKARNESPDQVVRVSAGADLVINDAIRATLDGAIEQLNPGNKSDVRKILHDYRDLVEMDKHVTEASQTWDAQKRFEAGERAKIFTAAARVVARATTRGSIHGAAGVGTGEAHGFLNNPDQLVKKGFGLLSHVTPSYQIPIRGTGPAAPPAGQSPGGQAIGQPSPSQPQLGRGKIRVKRAGPGATLQPDEELTGLPEPPQSLVPR